MAADISQDTGIGNRTLMQFIPASALDADRDRALREEAELASRPHVTELAGHIRQAFLQAEAAKTRYVTDNLLSCARQRAGEYEPRKLAQITKAGGSDQFFNITETKCSALEAWLQDVIAPAGEDPFELEPTPVPSLPQDLTDNVIKAAVLRFQLAIAESGMEPSVDEVQEWTNDLYDVALMQYREIANERVQRMEDRIRDELVQSNFIQSLHEFLHFFVTYPTAFLKGPFLRRKKVLKWENNVIQAVWRDVHCYEAVNPQDMFPAPNARNLNEGPLCQLVTIDLQELAAMKDQPNWDLTAIDVLLRDAAATSGNPATAAFVYGEVDRATREGRDTALNGGLAPGMIRGIEYWGAVQGRVLAEWGMPHADQLDPIEFHEIHSFLFGDQVVYATMNPDPLGGRPYMSACYEPIPGSIWGRAMPLKMRDCQDAVNACLRNLFNNMAMSSGPQYAIDRNALDASLTSNEIFPHKIWWYDGSKLPSSGRQAVEFFQPSSNANVLIDVSEFFEGKADDRTMVPRYTHGDGDVGGAGETLGGLNALLDMASKGVRRMVSNIDMYVVKPAITNLYNYLMLYDPDQAIKGDAQVRPRGVLAVLQRDLIQQRRTDFLALTNNPIDYEIVGMEGRAQVLRSVAAKLDLPVDKIVPDDEVLRQRVQQAAIQQAQLTAEERSAGEPTAGR